MAKAITEREPLTRDEVLEYLNNNVSKEVKQWGENSYYADLARRNRDEKIAKFDNGEAIPVYSESYVDSYGNGCGDYLDTLYSDGTVHTACYGYID